MKNSSAFDFSSKEYAMATRPSFFKQCAAFLFSALIIFQSCVSAAYAAQSVSQVALQSAVRSPLFKPSNDTAYSVQPIDQAATQEAASQHIASFYEKMRLGGLNVGKATPVPIAGDITIFIPVYLPGKLIGNNYVQNRIIRQQVFDLLGRHVIYARETSLAENAQNDRLYNNAFDFANSTKIPFGQVLNPAQVEQFGRDIIWPEYRAIDGQTTLVPVLYLTEATVTANKVQGTRTELYGSSASLNSVTLDEGTLTTGAKTLLQTRGNISLANGAAIKAEGEINLTVGGTLDVIGGSISATRNLSITANQLNVKTTLMPLEDRFGSGTRLGKIAQIESSTGNIIVNTAGDITFEGANATASNGGIRFNANGNIVIKPVFTNYSSQTELEQTASLNVIGSKLSAQDTISLISSGEITISASELISTQGGIELLAKQGIHILDELSQEQKQRIIRSGKTTGQSSEFRTQAVRAILKAGKGVLLDTAAGDVELRAANITSQSGTEVTAHNGKVRLLMTKELEEFHLNTTTKKTWTIKTRTEDVIHENNIQNTIVGGLQVRATYGVDVEYTGIEGASVKQQIDAFRSTPGMEWIATLHDQAIAQADPSKFNWQAVEEVHQELRKTSRTLSPAAMALVAIAVAVAMGPAGAGWIGASGGGAIGGAVGGGTLGAALNAGAVTLATQASQSLAAGNSPSATLKSMGSSESLKSLAVSMVTAGALQNTDIEMFSKASASKDLAVSLAGQAGQAVINSTVSAGISLAINGGNSESFKQAFIQNLATSAVNKLGEKMANKIGIAYRNSEANGINNVIRYVAHAGAGCVLGLASGAVNASDDETVSCLSGAGGAVVGELVADNYKRAQIESLFEDQQAEVKRLEAEGFSKERIVQELSSPESQAKYTARMVQMKAAGVDLAKLSGAFAAFLAQGDVSIAAMTAENAAKNNALFLIPLGIMALKAIDIALTASDLWAVYLAFMSPVPGAGPAALAKFLGEEGAAKLVGKAIPGFRTGEELVDWLRKNDYLSDGMVDAVKKAFGERKMPDATPPNFHPSGARSDFYDIDGRSTHYKDPLDGQIKPIPTDRKIHQDHIFPKNSIERLPGFDRLTPAQQKLILNDPKNFQPLPASLNCSKGCKVGDNPWETYRGEPLDPGYIQWLKNQQNEMMEHLTARIKEVGGG
jgi:filamentous hemagglutinin